MNNLKIYNTLNRRIEKFIPQNPKEVKIYTCGPTVYGYQHIGNYAAYIYWDLLIRTLEIDELKVKRVLNLTDVGHLASDADDGEDKLEKGARRENKTVWEVADFYAEDFLRNFRALSLVQPEVLTRATDYIKEEAALVEKLREKGFLYETKDGLYFDTAKFPKYADFAQLKLEKLKAGARVELSEEKRNVSDFAVWKFIQDGENHAMRWNYFGREGYPGWHLECSTIIHEKLGEPIDIHTGGVDHIPVHHTNEIAQSEAAFGEKLANYWLHCNFITIEGEKVSKSLGNTYTLDDLKNRGFSPLDFKMWVLQGHYQSERNFTFESLEGAKNRRLNWRNRIAKALWQKTEKGSNSAGFFDQILEKINDNLNSAAAFAIIDQMGDKIGLDDWKKIDEVFGLELISSVPDLTDKQKELIEKRAEARTTKNFELADKIRDELEKQGITVSDTKDGQIWQFLD